MSVNRIALMSVSAVLLAACATPYEYWHKDGVSKQEALDQLGYCRKDVDANRLEKQKAAKLVFYCMKANGYRLMRGYR